MKKIWLVSHYAMPPELEQRVKTLRYAQILQERGYDVKMITASTIHNTDINLINDNRQYLEKTYDGIDYVHIKTPNYQGNGIRRILNLLAFSYKFPKVAKNFDKPDVIVADVNCVNYTGIYKYCRKNGIKFCCDIRDLWPLSIVEYLGIRESNPIIKFLYGQERKLYSVSDAIIFSMEGGKQYIIDKGWDKKIDLNKVFNINNGIDTEGQLKQISQFQIEDPDLENDKFKVVYAGSIREVNDINKLVDVAKYLQNIDKNIEFLIYGDGNQRDKLENKCKKEEIKNIVFKGRVDKKYVPYICSKADINIINVMPTDINRYGVSWNKLFDYMVAGKPIVSTVKVNYDYIEKYNCGETTENQNVETIANAIIEIKNMSKDEYESMCQNARNAAKDFDFNVLTNKLEEVVNFTMEKK